MRPILTYIAAFLLALALAVGPLMWLAHHQAQDPANVRQSWRVAP